MPSPRNPLELIALALVLALPAQAQVGPEETDPVKIMTAVQNRTEGDKVRARMVMTIGDQAGRERTRALQSRTMLFPEGKRQILVFVFGETVLPRELRSLPPGVPGGVTVASLVLYAKR